MSRGPRCLGQKPSPAILAGADHPLLGSRKAADRPSTAAAPTAAAADEDDLPIPSGIKAVFLGGLFLLAMLAACYVAAEIVLPIVPAFVLSLVLQPAMRVLERPCRNLRAKSDAKQTVLFQCVISLRQL
jgi:hypothetical protein